MEGFFPFLITVQLDIFWQLFLPFFLTTILKNMKFPLMEDSCNLLPLTSPGKMHLTTKTLGRCICKVFFFQCKRNQCSKEWVLTQQLLCDALTATCQVTQPAGTSERTPFLSGLVNKAGLELDGTYVDGKLDFAGDDAGYSIGGSLTSESVLSWQTSVIPRAVCCWKCCIAYRRC